MDLRGSRRGLSEAGHAAPGVAAGWASVRPVSLVLDLCFAIAPETHPVLEYSIEVNTAPAQQFEARWPNRWRIHRIPLKPAELAIPCRITFTMRNPVSTRVLKGGASHDGRILGIGLLKATYEMAEA